MPTPHNSASKGDIAETILLPGDPLRAKVVAELLLTDPVRFNSVRNMYGYTGTYRGKPVSIMGTGMGMPSIGIYSYELIHFYGVKNLIRIGSCGSMTEKAGIGSIIMAQGACTDSNYSYHFHLPGTYSAIASFDLLSKAVEVAEKYRIPYHVGNVVSGDVFYHEEEEWRSWAKMGCLGVEMETYALYCNAARAGVRALGIFTVSDSFVTGEETTAEERQNNFVAMMKIGLETAVLL